VGIGGAGMSSYALLAKAWGAEVGGWDRHETPYLGPVREAGIDVVLSAEPEAPEGWEVVVSSAFSFPGRSRAELLAELVAARPSIVVAGAHGKSTTAAMIAFALRELGEDPAWLIGAEVPQLGTNAGTGLGRLVAEGDESDRTIELLHPEIAVITNVDLDHHSTFSSRADVEAVFQRFASQAAHVVHGDELTSFEHGLSVPGEHNRRNAAAALAALELAGAQTQAAVEALARFRGVGRRLELRGEAGGVAVYDDYAHNPEKVAATVAAAREIRPGGRVLVLFQPHLYSRTRHSARELAAALAGADAVGVVDVYPAREEPVAGVTGKLVVDAIAELRPGSALAWTPTAEDGVAYLAARARRGDIALTVGAGDVDRAAPLLLEALR
jgi:UDP-N-acetylmuramate--alanine ligase